MPFDASPAEPDAPAAQNRRKLLDNLRHGKHTRAIWNFAYSDTCALGACMRLGIVPSHEELGLDWATFDRLFCMPNKYGVPLHAVTPDMVADALEAVAD